MLMLTARIDFIFACANVAKVMERRSSVRNTKFKARHLFVLFHCPLNNLLT